jgi:hypothetical protein
MLFMLQDEIDYGFAGAQWNPVGLTDGEYELVVHVLCETAGLSFPPPGIDDYYSAPVRGVRIYLSHACIYHIRSSTALRMSLCLFRLSPPMACTHLAMQFLSHSTPL